MVIRLPKPLPLKATIGIVAPASPQRDVTRLNRGIAYLESLGHTVVCSENLHAVHGGYLAGTDEQRVADLHSMFSDKRIDAIFCSRGGYGSARLLDKIDYSIIRRNPKIFVGFSDITALQLAMFKRTGLVTFSGALPSVDMADVIAPETEEWFWRILRNTKPLGVVQNVDTLNVVQQGRAEGRLVGGNLSVLVTLLGTSYMPSLRDAVLVLEDVGEETYRLDRMLNHLRLSGGLAEVSGVVCGQWTQPNASARTTPDRDVTEMLVALARDVSGPLLTNLMYGHEARKLTLPIGVHCSVSSRHGLRLLGAAVQA